MSGTLAIPNDMTNLSTDSIGHFMANWFAIRDYVNVRELGVGLLANRPAAGHNGSSFLATDIQGGTVYMDDGTSWRQAGAGVLGPQPAFTVVARFPYVEPQF